MITAHNHIPIRARVNVAQMIYDTYQIEKAQGNLVGTDHIMPDEENLLEAIKKGKQSAIDGKNGYNVNSQE